MSFDFEFEGQVIPLEWGKSTYTILVLPDDIAEALRDEGAKRVEGEINDHPVNLALSKAPVLDGTFLWTGRDLLNAADIEPGQRIAVRLRAIDPNQVDLPADVANALRAADKTEAWQMLTPGRRRAALHQITKAKRAATRTQRIAAMIDTLA